MPVLIPGQVQVFSAPPVDEGGGGGDQLTFMADGVTLDGDPVTFTEE